MSKRKSLAMHPYYVPFACRQCKFYQSQAPAGRESKVLGRTYGWCGKYNYSVHGNMKSPTCFRHRSKT